MKMPSWWMFRMPRWSALVALPVVLGGCEIEPELPTSREPVEEADTGMIDATMDLPPPADGVTRIETPDIVLEPFDEIIACYVGRFPDDVDRLAISWASMHEHPVYGHHIQFNGLREEAGEDNPLAGREGELIDCSDPLESMLASTNILNLNRPFSDGSGGEMVLPEATAVSIPGGSPWLFEYHVVNPTPRRLKARGVMDIRRVEPDTVQTWAAPFVFNDSGFVLPPGEETEVDVDCAWPEDARVLSVLGHMHDLGQAMAVDMVTPDGTRSTIYDLPEWQPDWRYMPYVIDFDGGLAVSAGTRFLTACTFFNPGSQDVRFPEEMCVASGMFFPAEQPLSCDSARGGE
jgi:hypothetical protein